MKTRKAIMLLLALAFGLNAIAADRYGFKEDKLGESMQDFKSKHPQSECFQQTCPAVVTILGSETMAFYQFSNGTLYLIQVPFSPTYFDDVLKAMKDKYGEAAESGTQDYQNRFGAHFTGRYTNWAQGADTMAVIELGGFVAVPLTGKIQAQYASILPTADPLKQPVLRIIDSAILKQLSKPKNPSDL